MSWFWNLHWWALGRDARKRALIGSYPQMTPRVIDTRAVMQSWFDCHRWNGSAGMTKRSIVKEDELGPDHRSELERIGAGYSALHRKPYIALANGKFLLFRNLPEAERAEIVDAI